MPDRIVALDSSDAKFMALLERFSERLEWMKGDADQRNKQLELQAHTLSALDKGMAKMEGMISAMRDELRATAALSMRVVEIEKRVTRLEDAALQTQDKLDALVAFKDTIIHRLATVGFLSFIGGGGVSMLAIKILFGS